MKTNKQWKRVPFDIELAKKIQSGEVKGVLLMKPYKSEETYPVIILTCDAVHNRNIKGSIDIVVLVQFLDGDVAMQFNSDGYGLDMHGNDVRLFIELLEETPKHEFKVGDKVRVNFSEERLLEMKINGCYQGKILTVTRIQPYGVNAKGDNIKETFFMFADIEPYEETQKHEFKPFDKVLVRNTNTNWFPSLFSCKELTGYRIVGGELCDYCIPYEGNEHLVGTTNQ